MKPHSFAALAVITLFAVAISLTTYASQNRWSQAKVSGAALFPGLGGEAGRIAKIEIACSPCFKRECAIGHFKCMRDLAPDAVYDSARTVVDPAPNPH